MNTHATYRRREPRNPHLPRHPLPADRRPSTAAEAAPVLVTVLGALALVLIGAPLL
jgi:hypothetical protein